MAKKRLDVLLFEKGLCPSRERAKTAIMEGIVYIAGQKAGKAGDMVDENAELEVRGNDNAFVSLRRQEDREGAQLLCDRPVRPDSHGRRRIDRRLYRLPLRRGAEKVYSIDVGYGPALHGACCRTRASSAWSAPISAM